MGNQDQLMFPELATSALDAKAKVPEGGRRRLQDDFVVPPFTVLDARQGYWQDRKRAWIALGIRGEQGRADVLPSGAGSVYSGSSAWSGYRGTEKDPITEGQIKNAGRTFGQDLMRGEHVLGKGKRAEGTKGAFHAPGDGQYEYSTAMLNKHTGTSIFDPVLAELAYRWFAPAPVASILDPFAGGSTRGVVAAYLGHQYIGVELRPEQIAANERQWDAINDGVLSDDEGARVYPAWLEGDSELLWDHLPKDDRYDLIFTCPPYYDLEVYSAKKGDGSAFSDYASFLSWYRRIFTQCEMRLKHNRFLAIVVGDVRDKDGVYRNFPGDTIRILSDLGLKYYNEAILVTAIGSLPLRIGRQFGRWRKLGKTHQQLLVFYKGTLSNIPKNFPALGALADEAGATEAE